LKVNLPIQQLSSHLPVAGSHVNLTCLKSDEMLFCKLSCCLIKIEDHERRASIAEEKMLERNARRRAAYHRKKLEKESNNADNLSIEHPNVVPGNHMNLVFYVADDLMIISVVFVSSLRDLDDEPGELGEGWLSRNTTFTSRSVKLPVANTSIHAGLVSLSI
jgi:hypothetical protein